MQLRNRQKQIPNGIFFYEPRTKWHSSPGSFSSVVDQMIAHRQGNSWLGLSTDRPTVENELDTFAAKICEQMGWTDYIIGGNPNPPPPPPLSLGSRVANVVGASPVIVEWIASGAEAVPHELSEKRAKTCAECPLNDKGDLLRFFTLPVAEGIRKALNARREMKLESSEDWRLGVCSGCDCPLRLKIHMPIERVRSKLKPEVLARLDPRCWITHE